MVKIREEIEKWQASLSGITERMTALETQLTELSQTATAESPETAQERARVATELTELRDELAALKAAPPTPVVTPPEPNPPSNDAGEGTPIPATPRETSLDQPPLTRAGKKGWL